MKRLTANFTVALVSLYACLAALDFSVYYLLPLPEMLPKQKAELLFSYNIVANNRHPQYRVWLKSFVGQPGHEAEEFSANDSYSVYGVKDPRPQNPVLAKLDALGWPNVRTPAEAEVLFIGDSFCYGAGVGSAESIPVLYERATGKSVYAACRGGYGLENYVRILDRLSSAPDGSPERFSGRDVYVLLYSGNDLTSDMEVYRRRMEDENNSILRRFELKSLWGLCKLYLDSRHGLAVGLESQADPAGFYPVYLDCQTFEGLPFAFHPFYELYRNIAWFGKKERDDVVTSLAKLAELARQRNLNVRVAAIPAALQVLAPHVDKARLFAGSRFALSYQDIAKNFRLLHEFGINVARDKGLACLDIAPLLVKDPGLCQDFWPNDTHLTLTGNRLVVGALLDNSNFR